mmetsp:Transcript_9925/g.26390  ORF Transcript_9925/g.26390 Transcript_9925/m.26390 type:complete len:164 (-) Transcript_9925:1271-1762(-)
MIVMIMMMMRNCVCQVAGRAKIITAFSCFHDRETALRASHACTSASPNAYMVFERLGGFKQQKTKSFLNFDRVKANYHRPTPPLSLIYERRTDGLSRTRSHAVVHVGRVCAQLILALKDAAAHVACHRWGILMLASHVRFAVRSSGKVPATVRTLKVALLEMH